MKELEFSLVVDDLRRIADRARRDRNRPAPMGQIDVHIGLDWRRADLGSGPINFLAEKAKG